MRHVVPVPVLVLVLLRFWANKERRHRLAVTPPRTSPHNFITPLWGRIYYVLDTALLCKIHIEFGRLLAPGRGGSGRSIRTFGDAAAADDDFGVDCSSDGEQVKEGFVVQYLLRRRYCVGVHGKKNNIHFLY